MSHTSLACAFVALGLLTAGCSSKTETTTDGGTSDAGGDSAAPDVGGDVASDAGGSISCYIADQFVCEENPSPTAEQTANLRVVCSSGSGVFETPAKCPLPAFVGKCTITSGTGTTIRRYYTGVDVAYTQDFCVNTALGVWSTTF